MRTAYSRGNTRRGRRLVPPGGTDRFSTEGSFSPPIGPRWAGPAAERGYYIDFRVKADRPEWPPAWLLPADKQLHVAAVQWGLGAWERFLAAEGEAWRTAACAAADHLIETQAPEGARKGAWLQWVPMPHTYRIDPPWASAITQGEAASFLARIHIATGDERYAEGARRALQPMRTPVNSGGVLTEIQGGPFFEEYPTIPSSMVLNGDIFALWGFRDLAELLDDAEAKDWYEAGVDTLAAVIDRYDVGYWSRYDLYPHPLTNVASSAYHLLHINQLNLLSRQTGNRQLADAYERFRAYRSSLACRSRALDRKIGFRLMTPRNRVLAQRLPWNVRARKRHGGEDLVVLGYHAVSDDWSASLTVTREQLRSQLTSLLERGYRPTTFSEGVLGARSVPSFVVTFDDAFRSVFDRAKPILDELGVPGTVFVPTAFAGQEGPMCWPGISHWLDDEHAEELCPMNWETLRALASDGWEIGSHTATHARLTDLSDAEATEELSESRRECERRLQAPCLSLAYPYGAYDHRVKMLAAAAGYAAAATLPPPFGEKSVMGFPRVGVYRIDTHRRFGLKIARPVRRLRGTKVGIVLGAMARRSLRPREVPS